MSFTESFLEHCTEVLKQIQTEEIEKLVTLINQVRGKGGRLFIIGSGGGAGHASHAVCDFRKLCDIESYSPYDNISELTARVNDEGWDVTISSWLKTSKLNENDCLFVFSVGGGSKESNISVNIVNAIKLAKKQNASVVGIVGKDGGYTKEVGDAVIVIPTVNNDLITPLTEGFQALIWHLLISHPLLKVNQTKWESTQKTIKELDYETD